MAENNNLSYTLKMQSRNQQGYNYYWLPSQHSQKLNLHFQSLHLYVSALFCEQTE